MGMPDLDVITTHKILHHKRPDVFPLFDRETARRLGEKGAWVQIHHELAESRDEWAGLEVWFAGLATGPGDVALTLLRLHDILVWSLGDEENRRGCPQGCGGDPVRVRAKAGTARFNFDCA
jgi:hypothetical protein